MNNEWSEFDRMAMARALELARLGLYTTDPNPRVGCVIALGNRVLAEGWHERAGEAHAEVRALQQCGAAARGATAYVTLEPCSHTGRTGPCVEALIQAGVGRVVFAVEDPDPRVRGAGAARLRSAGIETRTGLLAEEAWELNPGFLSRHERGRPWVRLKSAASLDGRTALASGQSRWITGQQSRADVQHWRARSSALLTGVGTVLADDPQLTVRVGAEPRRQPLRVVLDSRWRTPPGSKLISSPGRTLVMGVGADHDAAGCRARLDLAGAQSVALEAGAGGVDLGAALGHLAGLGVNEVLVEAGATLSGALLRAGLIDEWLLYLAPTLLGPDARPLAHWPQLGDLAQRALFELHEVRTLESDVLLRLRPAKPRSH